MTLLERCARLALPSSGWGFLYAWLHRHLPTCSRKWTTWSQRWTQKLTDFANALNAYDALPAGTSDADRFAAL